MKKRPQEFSQVSSTPGQRKNAKQIKLCRKQASTVQDDIELGNLHQTTKTSPTIATGPQDVREGSADSSSEELSNETQPESVTPDTPTDPAVPNGVSADQVKGTLAYEIRDTYDRLKSLEFSRYLQDMRLRFEKDRPYVTKYSNPEIAKLQLHLDQLIGTAALTLGQKLADREYDRILYHHLTSLGDP